jgi:hypothetical protein
MKYAAMTAGALGLLMAMISLGMAQSQHVSEAITHAQAAVAQGKQSYPDALVTQAQEALKHAEMAKEQIRSPHLEEGMRFLKEAIDQGRRGQGEPATKSAESALTHFQELNQASSETAQGDRGETGY